MSLTKIPFERRVDALTAAPARILGLKGKGRLEAGADAFLSKEREPAEGTISVS